MIDRFKFLNNGFKEGVYELGGEKYINKYIVGKYIIEVWIMGCGRIGGVSFLESILEVINELDFEGR